MEKKLVLISGFNTSDPNRGTAALSYGSINFCYQNGFLQEGQEIVSFWYIRKFWKPKYRARKEQYVVCGKQWIRNVLYVPIWEKKIYDLFGIILPFTKFGKAIKSISLIAAINGGDGFSDIYSTNAFFGHISECMMALKKHIPYVILPQTIGPFDYEKNKIIAKRILQGAKKVYIRDDKYLKQLNQWGIKCEIARDLSAYMEPLPCDMDIKHDSIGINISGLCYFNNFGNLAGQFALYPKLIDRIINHFQEKGTTVYLIPHSYRYGNPEPFNDDIEACRITYENLKNKTNVYFVNRDLTSPEVKYVISQMAFFIGTRMHANFAAIYTNVPLFGLAYSYKFEGAFNANGLDGKSQTIMVKNITEKDIDIVINKIDMYYNKSVNNGI